MEGGGGGVAGGGGCGGGGAERAPEARAGGAARCRLPGRPKPSRNATFLSVLVVQLLELVTKLTHQERPSADLII